MRIVTLLLAALLLPAVAGGQDWRGPAALAIRVESAKGRNLAGAEILLVYLSPDGGGNLPPVLTDANGQANIGGLAAGRWTIEIRSAGHMSYRAELALAAEGKPVVQSASHLMAPGATSTMKIKFSRGRGGTSATRPALPAPGSPAPALPAPVVTAKAAPAPAPVPVQVEKAPAKELPPVPGVAPAPVPVPVAERAPVKEQPSVPAVAPASAPVPIPAAPKVPVKELAPVAKVAPAPAPVPAPAAEKAPVKEVPPVPAVAPSPAPVPAPIAEKAPVREQPSVPAVAPASTPVPIPAAPKATVKEPPPVAIVAPAPPLPAPPVPARARLCVECPPGESAAWGEAAIEGGAKAGCPEGLATRLKDVDLAAVVSLSEELAAGGAGCRILAVELPAGARFTGFRYEAQSAAVAADCLPGRGCPAGDCRFPNEPVLRQEGNRTVLLVAFESTAADLRRAVVAGYSTDNKR